MGYEGAITGLQASFDQAKAVSRLITGAESYLQTPKSASPADEMYNHLKESKTAETDFALKRAALNQEIANSDNNQQIIDLYA